ncbi:hypothetical protein BGZ96_002866 [Linnemannia gamsii]|uniref:F-box domain-containing protein n=1 Tax=Linnemannia gamsii TaxID=64522 RepID=A0ABQ7K7J8_9FUNG|nr:hypothetical protein BGZ96_002866 [Linnemannia gamsii]
MASIPHPRHRNPFDIPEIRSQVLSYLIVTRLPMKDLSSCLRVSNSWSGSTLPLIWSSINFNDFHTTRRLTSFQRGVSRHGHLIRKLFLEYMDFEGSFSGKRFLQEGVLPYCRELQQLELTEKWGNGGADRDRRRQQQRQKQQLSEWADITTFIQQNPGLRSLRIRSVHLWAPPLSFWKALDEDLPQLRTVQFLRVTVGEILSLAGLRDRGDNDNGYDDNRNDDSDEDGDGHKILERFLAICNRTEELHLDGVVILVPCRKVDSWLDGVTFPRLQKLIFHGQSALQLQLFCTALDAPQLRELTWGSPIALHAHDESIPTSVPSFVTAEIVKRHLALEKLNVQEDQTPSFQEGEIESILKSLSKPLIQLRVYRSEFSSRSLKAILEPQQTRGGYQNAGGGRDGDITGLWPSMMSHSSWLQNLDLQGCVTVTSRMVLRLLQNCHQLQVFKARQIRGVDILYAQRKFHQQQKQDFEQDEGQGQGQGQGRPTWSCSNMVDLEVFISVSPGDEPTGEEDEEATAPGSVGFENDSCNIFLVGPAAAAAEQQLQIQQAIYRELGQLTGLRRLAIGNGTNMDFFDSRRKRRQGVDLRLVSGLAQLSGLKRLQELNFCQTRQDMAEEDVDWMAERFCNMTDVPKGWFRHTEVGQENMAERFMKWRKK